MFLAFAPWYRLLGNRSPELNYKATEFNFVNQCAPEIFLVVPPCPDVRQVIVLPNTTAIRFHMLIEQSLAEAICTVV